MAHWKDLVRAGEWKTRSYTPVSPRFRLIQNIREQQTLFEDEDNDLAGKRYFKRRKDGDFDVVDFQVRFGNQALTLDPSFKDPKTGTCYEEEFIAVMDSIIEDVEAGAFDDQLAQISASFRERLNNKAKTVVRHV